MELDCMLSYLCIQCQPSLINNKNLPAPSLVPKEIFEGSTIPGTNKTVNAIKDNP